MGERRKSLSQLQLAFRHFAKSHMAMFCFVVLILLYVGAIFADFLSPYSYDNENREYSYCPPMSIKIFDEEGHITWPYVQGYIFSFNKNHRRVYQMDRQQKHPIRLFVKGDGYKLLGLFPCRWHLLGVDSPGRLHIWGADSRGRDLFSRLLYGSRVSLSIGLIGVMISFSIGLLVGGIAGYYGGKIDNVIMRICEMFMMVPGFYLMLALRSAVPEDFNSFQVYLSVVIILSFIGWASLARIIRGMSLSLKEREYVLAAKAIGLSDFAIIVRHILPHTLSYSIVAIMLSIPGYILGEAALSLIGLGIQDPIASWGNLLSDAMGIVQIKFAPWILLPGIFIFVTVICFNVIGDALRDCLDPLYKSQES